MAKPGIIYRVNWQSFHESTDIQCYVDISDNDHLIDDGDSPVVYELIGAGVSMSVIDNDDNPLKAIRGQQLTIQFNSTANYSMATFSSGSDLRWSVHYYITDDTQTVFKGFLVLDDLNEPLLPPTEVVTLTATDGLGLLRDIPLTNSDDEAPRGIYSIISIIDMCLAHTGLDLSYNVAFNIKLDGLTGDISSGLGVGEHLFETVYLDIKTFEDEIGTCINCYDVISKILGNEACLFQMKGKWWILRIDEVEDATRGLYVFPGDGVSFSEPSTLHFDKLIGKTQTIKFTQEATIVKAVRPKKSARLNYMYEKPLEIPNNVNFVRGDLINGTDPLSKTYKLEAWNMRSVPLLVAATDATCYLKRSFNANGYETERYIVITPSSDYTDGAIAQAEPFYVGQKDRITISVDFRIPSNLTGSSVTFNICNALLVGDSGTYQFPLGNQDSQGKWLWTGAITAIDNSALQYTWTRDDLDETTWQSVSFQLADCPEDGFLYIGLQQFNQHSGSFDTINVEYSNLQVDVLPYINGRYTVVNGQYHRTEQTGNYKAKVEDEVYISDSPKKIFKGALLQIDSYSTVYSGSVTFATGTSFDISGVVDYLFRKGQILKISGTVSNNITTRVVSAFYHVLLGATTITVEDATVSETHSTLIETPVFILSDAFYNAAVNPSGPPSSDYVHTYGEIQLFDVWNQHKEEKRLLQNTCQGLDLDVTGSDLTPDVAHLINKWSCVDGSPHLDNKFFQLLSFNQNHDNGEWTGVLREVFDTTKEKDYSNHEFKFIENG